MLNFGSPKPRLAGLQSVRATLEKQPGTGIFATTLYQQHYNIV
jgi:hypothetical protein